MELIIGVVYFWVVILIIGYVLMIPAGIIMVLIRILSPKTYWEIMKDEDCKGVR